MKRRLNFLLLIIALSLLASSSSAPSAKGTSEKVPSLSPSNLQSSASVARLSDINLAAIGPLAPKGRVQDDETNSVVTNLIAHRTESIAYLISRLDDETKIKGHVLDYWSEVRVGDVALLILIDFFTDSSWQLTTIPGVGWNDFLKRGARRDLTSEQVLRNYISKHGRKNIKARWEQIWRQYRHRLFWDEKDRCFRVKE